MSTATHTGKSRAEKQRLFAALDLLQEQRAAADQKNSRLLDAKESEEDLYLRLRDLQVARGLPVNEEELRAAVRATREPTGISYQETPGGMARNLSTVYIKRAKWLPATTITCVLALAGWGTVETVQHVQEVRFERSVESAQNVHAELIQQVAREQNKLDTWPTGEGQSSHRAGFEALMNKANEQLVLVSKNLQTPSRASIESSVPLLREAKNSLREAQTFEASSRQQVKIVQDAKQWLSLSPDQRWPEAATRMQARQSQLASALSAGDIASAQIEMRAIASLSEAVDVRSRIREAVDLVPPVGQEEAQALKNRAESAILAGENASAQQALGDIRTLTEKIATSYTMKIVNENGVDTGFWRQHENSRSRYNYYVVVDALDASGNPVKIDVVNEENGERKRTSRFAVRVSESVFESVKADKMDNGLIDNPIVGVKKTGALDPEYHMDAGAGIITNW